MPSHHQNNISRLLRKLIRRYSYVVRSTTSDWIYRNISASKEERLLIKKFANFPILDSDELQRKCDYSFGDHSGVLGRVPGAFMKKANASNLEFLNKAKDYEGKTMTLFIDNIRLYKRPLAYSDWLHGKPISPEDQNWLDTMADEDLLLLCSNHPKVKFIIFTALEDTPLDSHIQIPENVISINAANAVYTNDKIIPYPHGLERKMYLGYNHHKILRRFLARNTEPNKLLFVSHRDDTGLRGGIKDLFKDKPWATVPPRLEYEAYLKSIQNHKFVLCPSGNGIESARNWETLYMKRVPVFKRHPYLEEMFKDFPVLFVEKFEDVTEELLLANEHLYEQAQSIDLDLLNLNKIFDKRVGAKTYDCFMFFNELDLLDIRLNVLDPHVDYFVLAESTQTFSGKEKPLYYDLNKEKFKKWEHKIIHHVVETFETASAFDRAAYQKDSIREKLQDCNPEDSIYYGDADEIWKPQDIGSKIYKLRQLNYSYFLDNRSSEDWQGTNACKYKNLVNLNVLRANHKNVLEDGGWHFTNMGGAEQILKKLDAYDHQEMNTEKNRERLKERLARNEDYVGRKFDWKGRPFRFWTDESELPEYLKKNKSKYEHLFKPLS